MYLYKYLFKGPDHTAFNIVLQETQGETEEPDEFKDYINGRYLSSSEAVWRIFNFHITQQTPAVKPLRVHLPQQQLYQMQRKNIRESGASQLLRYFCRPLDSSFDTLLYSDYFAAYILYPQSSTIYNQQNPTWTENYSAPDVQHIYMSPMVVHKRSAGKIICRLRTVLPQVGELFYLRILLLHKHGRSFSDIKTISGVEYHTFQEAAKALGLFDNEHEALYALEEGLHLFYRPTQLRFLFANLLFDIPFPPIELWNRFRDSLCADCQPSPTQQIDYDIGLRAIDHILRSRGGNLQSFGLPVPQQQASTELSNEMFLLESQASLALQEAQEREQQLTRDQKNIFDIIVKASQNNESLQHRVFFIDGPAGRGKTFLMNTIIQHLRGNKHVVVIVGTTALSVTLYERGRTAHSMFGIPINEVS